jgi:DNA-binding PadR family transcriptional regulator
VGETGTVKGASAAMTPRQTELLVQALKSALGQTEPLPLYKVGKQSGLFGKSAEEQAVAELALAHGLLVVARSEEKGKTTTVYVELTPRGVHFLQQHDSPKVVLQELLQTLEITTTGLPRWAGELKAQLQALSHRLETFLEQQEQALHRLHLRVEEALRRVGAPAARSPTLEPWQLDALDYLDRCHATGVHRECSFSELFAALRQNHPDLELARMHAGLLHLRDRGAIKLVARPGPVAELPEPEYALLEGAQIFVAAVRA